MPSISTNDFSTMTTKSRFTTRQHTQPNLQTKSLPAAGCQYTIARHSHKLSSNGGEGSGADVEASLGHGQGGQGQREKQGQGQGQGQAGKGEGKVEGMGEGTRSEKKGKVVVGVAVPTTPQGRRGDRSAFGPLLLAELEKQAISMTIT